MGTLRKPHQGIINIIRFNWHFYVIASMIVLIIMISFWLLDEDWHWLAYIGLGSVILPILASLLISWYIYDLSDLYQLKHLIQVEQSEKISILNLTSGFDETSEIIKSIFIQAELSICDFYDPSKHTEVSIRRARALYSPLPDTIQIKTSLIPYPAEHFDLICIIFAAHEIRDFEERLHLFNEVKRVLKPGGNVYVTEHLRDFNNFMVYTIGSFHFFTKSSWLKIFGKAGLSVVEEMNSTPFVTTFNLKKNGVPR